MAERTHPWQQRLASLWCAPVVVLGVGRREHGDDAAGPLLIDRLPEPPGLVPIDCGPAPENFLGVVVRHRPGLVLLADAVHTGSPPGTVQLLAPEDLAHTDLGTHGLTPALFLKALRAQLDVPCLVLAIEPRRVGPDLPLSPIVVSAVVGLARRLGELAAEHDTP